MKNKFLFFDSSKLLFAQITNLFDFAWPTVAAMWNLRQQVNEYLTANPKSTASELNKRFTKGSRGDRADLKKACIKTEWVEQENILASVILINSFAIYESWVHQTLKHLGYKNDKFDTLEYNLKKSSIELNGKYTGGIQFAINKINFNKSNVMTDLFYNLYSSHSKNSLAIIDNLMICYKYFKEVRNSIMHKGAVVDKVVYEAYGNYSNLSPTDLGASEVPIAEHVTLGNPIRVNIRGAVGFCDIILKLVATLDAEISVSERAYKIMKSKLDYKTEKRIILSGNMHRKSTQINSIFNKIDMPAPLNYLKAEDFLKSIFKVS